MAKVARIEARISTSVKLYDIMHSFTFGIIVDVEPEDNLEEVKAHAWKTCEDEVEWQVNQVIEEERSR